MYEGLRNHTQPTASIRIETGDVPSKRVNMLGVLFPTDRTETTLRIARGNALDPAFEDLV